MPYLPCPDCLEYTADVLARFSCGPDTNISKLEMTFSAQHNGLRCALVFQEVGEYIDPVSMRGSRGIKGLHPDIAVKFCLTRPGCAHSCPGQIDCSIFDAYFFKYQELLLRIPALVIIQTGRPRKCRRRPYWLRQTP